MTFKTPRKQRYLSPKAYLKEAGRIQSDSNVEQVMFVPPQIGKPGYGKFLVKYKMPELI